MTERDNADPLLKIAVSQARTLAHHVEGGSVFVYRIWGDHPSLDRWGVCTAWDYRFGRSRQVKESDVVFNTRDGWYN